MVTKVRLVEVVIANLFKNEKDSLFYCEVCKRLSCNVKIGFCVALHNMHSLFLNGLLK